MAAYMKPVQAPVLLLLLVCLAIHSQCGRTEDMDNVRISLPHGLCAYKPCKDGYCNCCYLTEDCYLTMDACKKKCNGPHSRITAGVPTPSISARPSD
ncbi:hypothetical protein ACQJBY_038515 [Aegilops geniculata]